MYMLAEIIRCPLVLACDGPRTEAQTQLIVWYLVGYHKFKPKSQNAISAWAIIGNLVNNFSHQVDDNKTYCAVIVQGALLYVHWF